MNMYEKVRGFIIDIFCQPELAKIKQQRIHIINVSQDKQELSTLYDLAKERLNELTRDIKLLRKELRGDKSIPPKWLNENKEPYTPRVMVQTKSKTSHDLIPEPRSVFDPTNITFKNFIKYKEWNKLPHEEKLKKIWHFVIGRVTYEYDIFEDWRPSYVTYYSKRGDCEDTSLLFVDLCIAAGVPSDKIFVALGWYYVGGEEIGHAYPICKHDDGKWYIYESTLSFKPSKP